MPTPSDVVLPVEHEAIANRATCPPDESRSTTVHELNATSHESAAIDAPMQLPTPPPQEPLEGAHPPPESHSKPSTAHTDAPTRDIPTPMTAIEDTVEDQRASQASPLTANAPAPASLIPSHLSSPFPVHRVGYSPKAVVAHGRLTRIQFLPNSSSSLLRPGSRFKGSQTSDRQQYEVEVEVKHVDMRDSFMCGYLRIKGGLRQDVAACLVAH